MCIFIGHLPNIPWKGRMQLLENTGFQRSLTRGDFHSPSGNPWVFIFYIGAMKTTIWMYKIQEINFLSWETTLFVLSLASPGLYSGYTPVNALNIEETAGPRDGP